MIGASRETGKGEVGWSQTEIRKLTFILVSVGSHWGLPRESDSLQCASERDVSGCCYLKHLKSQPTRWHGPILSCQLSLVPPGAFKIALQLTTNVRVNYDPGHRGWVAFCVCVWFLHQKQLSMKLINISAWEYFMDQ